MSQSTVSMELFGPAGNNAVLRAPGRRFPGILVQGDSFNSLWHSVHQARTALRAGDLSTADDELSWVTHSLAEILSEYDRLLRSAGVRTPYGELSEQVRVAASQD